MRVKDCKRIANEMTRPLRGGGGHGPVAGNAEGYSWRARPTLAASKNL